METFLKKLATLLQSRRFLFTVAIILLSVFTSDEMVPDKEQSANEIVDAITALFPLISVIVGYITLMVSYTSRPTTGKQFFDQITNSEVLIKMAELIGYIKELVETDTE